jgi:hypothetical protein
MNSKRPPLPLLAKEGIKGRLFIVAIVKRVSFPFDRAQGLEFTERPLPTDVTSIF